MNKWKQLSVTSILAFSMLFPVSALGMQDGTYEATGAGVNGPISVEVVISDGSIEEVEVTDHMETPGIGAIAAEEIPEEILAEQTIAVDSVAGASVTSAVVKNLVKDCLEQADADESFFEDKEAAETAEDAEYTADVVIVGGGGAGLAASIRALEQGASVILVEKTDVLGGNSIVSGGIYNAPDPSMQDYDYQDERLASLETLITDALDEEPVSDEHKELQDTVRKEYEEYLESDKTLFDSPDWFALQTWNAGDKLGKLDAVKTLTANALNGLKWMEELGCEFEDFVIHGGGALYPRTHSAILPNGLGFIQAMESALEDKDQLTVLMHTEANDLLMDGDTVVGVTATGENGETITLHATNGVVLATGGFAGNVELRQEYCEGEKWPDLGPQVRTTNVSGVTGDGIFMAKAAGANLVNMDQIQLLPYCNPSTGFVNDCVGITDATIFINKEGKRFVREDGRRDEMSKAIIDQTDSMCWLVEKYSDDLANAETLAGQKVTYLIDNNISGYCYATSIAEAAEKMDVPEDVLRAEIEEYDENVRNQTVDKFGTASYTVPMEEGPFIMYQRRPAAHHTMGGVEIDTQAHALREDGSIIKGLYCAGEITGVIHGSNRVGGNAIVDFVVYGQIAGINAAKGE